MANLTTNPAWGGVPQLEMTTPAVGGPGGAANTQAQALANRTEQLAAPQPSTVTGTAYTLVLADAQSKFLRTTSASDVVVTVPADADVAFPVGAMVVMRQAGSGKLTVVGAGGATVTPTSGMLAAARCNGSVIVLRKTAANTWDLMGDLRPAVVVVTWASTISIDLSAGSAFRCTLAGNTTVNITGGVDGQKALIDLVQDATGSRLVTLGSGFAFSADITAYVASTAANKTDVLGVVYNSTAAKYRVLAVAKGF